MPYVTSIEKITIAEGKAEGRAEGKATVIVSLFRQMFGKVPKATEKRILALPLSELEQMQERLLQFGSASEVDRWLDDHAPLAPTVAVKPRKK